MKTCNTIISVAAMAILSSTAWGAEVAGQWKAEFETPRGARKVQFTFLTEGGKLTGRASSEFGGQTRESELKDGKIDGDTLSFTETLNIQGREMAIEYTGKVGDDGIAFSRKAGDFGTTEFKATRASPEENRPPGPREPTINRGQSVKLNPDDKPAFPDPPAGFKARREDIPHGKLEMVEYDSKSVGTKRKMNVYTPPGYSADRKFPVLYLLHGIGGDETEWQRYAAVDNQLDNLIADGKAVPMIVVMPNGRAQKNDRPEGNIYAAAPAFAAFERDLLDDVIPAIDSRYSTEAKPEFRALAGLSMGGGQSLNFGLAHPEGFAWVGGFSSAPNTKPPVELLPDPQSAKGKLKLLWLSCGNKDGLITISQGIHAYLKEKEVPHVWHVDGNGHDPINWSACLYEFSQKIFR